MKILFSFFSSITMKLHCNWKKLKTEFSLNIFLKAWFFLKIPTKGLYPAYNGEIWTGFDLFFVPKNLFQTNYTFLYCKFGHFPLFYKNTVRGLKIQAINYFFWILVYMIAIHHCAKEQLAWLDVVQIRAPYCTVQSSEILFHAVPCHPPVYNPPRQDVGTECRTGSFGSNLMSKHAQVKYNTQYSRRYLEYFTGKRPICHLQVKADQQVTWGLAILSGLLWGW